MGRRIELPQLPKGQTQEQLQALYSYLYQMAEALNNNLAEIGGAELTDSERKVMNEITGDAQRGPQMDEAETLKSLIIKTANFVRNELNQYRMNLLGDYVAEGKFGKYVRRTGLNVDVTPTGIQQNYTFEEIIQGLKTYEVNAKNYIKTGLLRTVNNIPVYGVAIGKDVVTFSEDGTETYNDGNKVAELTADELSFWQDSTKIASYTGTAITLYGGTKKLVIDNTDGISFYDGSTLLTRIAAGRIGFYYNGAEAFYILNGKMYAAGDMEITAGKTFKIASGGVMDVDTNNFKLDSANRKMVSDKWTFDDHGIEYRDPDPGGNDEIVKIGTENNELQFYRAVMGLGDATYFNAGEYASQYAGLMCSCIYSDRLVLGKPNKKIVEIFAEYVNYDNLVQNSSREIKHNIREMEDVGDKLDRLKPVRFIYNDDPENRERMGLIHEDTIGIMPEICVGGIEDDATGKAINYVELIPALIKEIQSLRERVKKLENK